MSLILALLVAAPALAQATHPCDGWQGQARNMVEPWEAHTRTFANGAIRVALLDTVEPASGAFYLLVLSPPYDELGSKTCTVIGAEPGFGFAGAFFDQMSASYDPARGLTLAMPVRLFAPATGGFDDALLLVTINQATGTIIPRYELT